ncbi:hypothetical protein D9619_005617 [Psilocybe cf. subviscida]|uniref:RING-type domain-containing protein n=1 Tax=Psilocybe cf. subviscida TaxID=2480587 RepID=A0A8H5BXK1_9AGAR|nr:hypothetical protein D9619_005617 [Psilocybe cf. subviscida]
MSNDQQDQDTSDFWEFVACAKCRMPFALESGVATVPFWLTECGHVMCNNHINSDQSCGQCGAQGIQVTPLHREVWISHFKTRLVDLMITGGGSDVGVVSKYLFDPRERCFQQDAMASQVRYHRTRHQQLRQMLEKLKREMSELKRENEALQSENQQYRAYHGHENGSDEPSTHFNHNGKRAMLNHQRPITGSSPRSIPTPLGPDRLTLQPGQSLHELSSHKHTDIRQQISAKPQEHHSQQRPMSTRSLEKYAYTPRENASFHAPQLTHAQAAPRYFQRADQPDKPQQPQIRRENPGSYQPPPSSSRFKPAPTQNHVSGSASVPPVQMGPPPVPRQRKNDGLPFPTVNDTINGHDRTSTQLNNDQRALLAPHLINRRASVIPGTPAPGQQLAATPRRFFPSTRGHTRPSMAAEGQRRPFFPN